MLRRGRRNVPQAQHVCIAPFHMERFAMLWTLAVILLVLWLLGFLAFHVTSGLIHILLVVAVIVGLIQLFTGRRAV